MIASIPATIFFFYVVKNQKYRKYLSLRLYKNLNRLKYTKEEWEGEKEGL